MPVNIEVKAKIVPPQTLADLIVKATDLCGLEESAILEQRDVFFDTVNKDALLKLRIEEDREKMDKKCTLVSYVREMKTGTKSSHYILMPVSDPEVMIDSLKMTNGILGDVIKTRHLFIAHRDGLHSRIHLDVVKGLGEFIEFEVIVPDESKTSMAQDFASFLCDQFELKEENHISGSYFALQREQDKSLK